MGVPTSKIEIFRGDTHTLTVTVKDTDGSVKDLTSYTMKFTAKSSKTDGDSDALIGPLTATISTPSSGVGEIAFAATDTNITIGTYDFDIQINNSTTDIKTIAEGEITIKQDVTKDAS